MPHLFVVCHLHLTNLFTLKPFTYNFPRADIHEILTPDLLHQVIKGMFKDHLVEWVMEWLILENGEARAKEILDDIDRRLVHCCGILLDQNK